MSNCIVTPAEVKWLEQAETQLEIIGEMFTENTATKHDLLLLEASLRTEMQTIRIEMHQLKNQLTVRLGVFFAFGFTSMTVLLKFWLIK